MKPRKIISRARAIELALKVSAQYEQLRDEARTNDPDNRFEPLPRPEPLPDRLTDFHGPWRTNESWWTETVLSPDATDKERVYALDLISAAAEIRQLRARLNDAL